MVLQTHFCLELKELIQWDLFLYKHEQTITLKDLHLLRLKLVAGDEKAKPAEAGKSKLTSFFFINFLSDPLSCSFL